MDSIIKVIKKHRDVTVDLPRRIDDFIKHNTEESEYHSYGWHPSALSKFCPREAILREKNNLPAQDEIRPRIRRLFDLGKDVHKRYQNNYLGPMGILWGVWECTRCKKRVWGLMPMPDWCDCNFVNKGWVYREVPIKYHPDGLEEPFVGKCDGILYINERWYLLDIKTSKNEVYTFLQSPHIAYKDQVYIYANMMKKGKIDSKFTNNIPLEKGILLYCNKNDSKHKSFLFDLDYKRGEELMEKAFIFERAKKENVLPKRLIECKSEKSKKAKFCKLAGECFGTT